MPIFDVLKFFCPLPKKGLSVCSNNKITCYKKSTRTTYKKVTRRKIVRLKSTSKPLDRTYSCPIPQKTSI